MSPISILAMLAASLVLLTLGGLLYRSRRKTELAFREADVHRREEVFRLLVEGSRDYAIFMLDPTGHIVSWNAGAENIKGYSAGEIIGKHFRTFYPEADIRAGKPEMELETAIRVGTYAEEGWRIRKDGSRFWASVLITALFDPDGTLRGFSKVTRDQTARKEAEEQARRLAAETAARQEAERSSRILEAQREQLRVTLESIGDAVIATDLHGNVTLINSVAQRLSGWTQQDAVGRPLTEVFDIRNDQTGLPAENPGVQVLREGVVFGLANHSVLVSRDGTVRPIDDSAAPILDRDGALTGVVLVFRDVTEQRRLESEIQARMAELAESDRKKDEFLAVLSHELRNPLAPLRYALMLLQQSQDREQTLETLELMERQLGHVVHIVGDLLDLNRISRGTLGLRRQAVTLSRVLEDALVTTRPRMERSRHRVEVELPEAPIWLDVDPTRVAQVFANVLNNAAKYTESAGVIRITAWTEATEAVVSIRDNGIGISPDMLPRVFEMFTQGHPTREGSQGGLGIGLSLVRRLVELHGGRVEARSEGPGRGSEFLIHLPVHGAPAAVEAPTQELPKAVVSRRVLVVDDNTDAATSLAQLLKLFGHTTRTAGTGLEALAVGPEFEPEAIVLDIGLPGLNGYDTCRQIRERPWGRDCFIVASTGWGQAEDRRQSEQAGFDIHLVKPVDPVELARLIEGGGTRREGAMSQAAGE
jgi:PAS domain S-box-containing protein